MFTRTRWKSLSGIETLEERRVLTAAVFLGQEFEMPNWVPEDAVLEAQRQLAGITFTD